MTPLLLALSINLLPVAAAQEAGAAPTAESAQGSSFDARLEEATSAYIQGDLPHARTLLLRLVGDPDLEPHELQEARIWLGEVEYMIGERDAARSTFRTVLLYDPDYRIDDFAHPPEVVAFFEATRAELKQEPLVLPPDLTPQAPRLPRRVALLMPGGMQIYNGRTALGVATFSGVFLMGSSTVPMRVWLQNQDQEPDIRGISTTNAPLARQVQTTQILLGSASLALWAGTTLGGVLRAGPASKAAFAVTPQPGGATVQVHLTLR